MKEEPRKKVTKYGEFIPTFYTWIGLEEQKEVVERLENISNKKNIF